MLLNTCGLSCDVIICISTFCCRRVYHVVDFVLFFFNVLLGLVSCLKRIIFSVIFGTMLLSRLDRPLLMEGFVTFDAGNITLGTGHYLWLGEGIVVKSGGRRT